MHRSCWIALVLAAFVGGSAQVAFAVPADPDLHLLRQGDGSAIAARLCGDESSHWWETPNGKPLVLNRRTQSWSQSPTAGPSKVSGPRRSASGPSRVVPGTGTANVAVILVNFPDCTPSYTTADFTDLLFGGGQSMKTFYSEASYGKFTVSAGPSGIVGWYTAAHPHDYYGANGSYGDMYAASLVIEAVKAADAAGFNFAPYDCDHDGTVDVVMVVHQGTGEEASGVATDIWSHRWTLNSARAYGDGSGTYTTNDGVVVNDYTIQPESYRGGISTVGVYCHEYGHALGLPDLYDLDMSSAGLGNWSLMATGSWCGTGRNGDSPSHPDAWCKAKLGWLTPTVQTTTVYGAQIPQVETNPFAYKLWAGGTTGSEYFLIENRQRTGFDSGLPNGGLCIYHVDDSQGSNNNEWYPGHTSSGHFRVALEQADGAFGLEMNSGRGDAGDPYPGSTANRTLSSYTVPDCRTYAGDLSKFAVRNIANSSSTATADIVFGEPYNADALVRVHGEDAGSYIADDLYNGDAANQTKAGFGTPDSPAVYDIKVQNDGNNDDSFKVTGSAGDGNWTVTYYDALSGGTDITSAVTSTGWDTGILATAAYKEIRVEVRPKDAVAQGTVFDVSVTATSKAEATKSDTVKGSTTKDQVVAIGGGKSSNNFPMGTWYHDQRTQVIYKAAEIGLPGVITSLALNVSQVPGQTLANWTIRMKHTTLSDYGTSGSWESSGWTTVYQANETVTTTGWRVFELQTPFTYNGTDNLMVDFSFNNSTYSTDGLCVYTEPGGNRTLSFRTDSAYGDPLTWSGTVPKGTVSTKVPDLHLALQSSTPTSYSISGHVLEGSLGLAGVTVTPSPSGAAVTTDSSGAYTITGLGAGTYTITPAKSGYVITPASATVSVGPDKTNVDFAAEEDITLTAPVMTLEPDFTVGDTNTVSWSTVTNATDYQVQRSTTSDFSADVVSGNWQTGTDYNYTGLTLGMKYYYRARARHVGAVTTKEGPWSSAVFSTQVAPTTLVYVGDTDKRQDEVITLKARLSSGVINLAGQPVSFTVGNFSGWANTDSTGVATVTIPANHLTAGTLTVYCWYQGDSSYDAARAEGTLIVRQAAPLGYIIEGSGWFSNSNKSKCAFKFRYDEGLVAGYLSYTDTRANLTIDAQICSNVVLTSNNDVATITGMCTVNGGAGQAFTLTVTDKSNNFTLTTGGYSVGPYKAKVGDILIHQ